MLEKEIRTYNEHLPELLQTKPGCFALLPQ